MSSLAIAAIGPGRWSVDHVLGIDSPGKPEGRVAVSLIVGVVGAVAQLCAFWRKPVPA